jgi:hypothetical protein
MSLFLLIDIALLTTNLVAFSGLAISISDEKASIADNIICVEAFIRLALLTFTCGQATEEVKIYF